MFFKLNSRLVNRQYYKFIRLNICDGNCLFFVAISLKAAKNVYKSGAAREKARDWDSFYLDIFLPSSKNSSAMQVRVILGGSWTLSHRQICRMKQISIVEPRTMHIHSYFHFHPMPPNGFIELPTWIFMFSFSSRTRVSLFSAYGLLWKKPRLHNFQICTFLLCPQLRIFSMSKIKKIWPEVHVIPLNFLQSYDF